MNQVDNSMGLYIHIPFCVRKCDYCDFLSAPAGREEQLRYMEALREEIRMVSGVGEGAGDGVSDNVANLSARPARTIFFGGGTPSILPAEEIARTLATVRACFDVAEDAEITVECNPGTLTEEKCEAYRACGVNRLSIGLQSADNRLLKNIGRIHTFEEFLESYGAARRAGFTNINIDLMSGLPGQRVGDHVDTLHRVLQLRPEHISAYSLILEEGTPLYERTVGRENSEEESRKQRTKEAEGDTELPQRTGKSENDSEMPRLTEEMERDTELLPTEDEEMEMYVKTREILEAHGYHRYEISNYSLPGKECRHNLRYWNLEEYLGFGIGAASFAGGCRFKNTDDRKNYVRLLRPEASGGFAAVLNRQSGGEHNKEEKGAGMSPEAACEDGKFEKTNESNENKLLREKPLCQGEKSAVSLESERRKELCAEFARETDRELMEEFVFLGLRKVDGIRTDEFADRFGRQFDTVYGDTRKKLTAQGFIQGSPDGVCLSLTDRGIDFSNEVLAEFLL